jgi:fucose 4-O-acetylase-like acetyltransferase
MLISNSVGRLANFKINSPTDSLHVPIIACTLCIHTNYVLLRAGGASSFLRTAPSFYSCFDCVHGVHWNIMTTFLRALLLRR